MAAWMLPGVRTSMVSAEDALPGREDPMEVPASHAVLGTALTGPFPDGLETAYLALGCFWGAERLFWELEGVHTTAVGYQGGHTPNPTYEEVCSGRTGHAESVMVVHDPEALPYEGLLAVFWENHDPTQGMRQGNDVGTQYRSAVFVTSVAQRETAKASRDRYQERLQAAGYGGITTEIVEAPAFHHAEPYHQQYLAENPRGYCNHGFCQVRYADDPD